METKTKLMKNTVTGVIVVYDAKVIANNKNMVKYVEGQDTPAPSNEKTDDNAENNVENQVDIKAVAQAMKSILAGGDAAEVTGSGEVRIEAIEDAVGFEINSKIRELAKELL